MSIASIFAASKTAVITGGASGIGLAVAQLCQKHGMKLAIVDFNTEYLAHAKKTLAAEGTADFEAYHADVSKPEEWKELREKVKSKFGAVDFLMLNAGVGGRGTWGDDAYFHKILDTNLYGVIHGINAFLPLMKSQPQENNYSIVVTGSKQGITNPPGNPAYNASKAAVKSLAEQLSFDLRGTNISAHLLVPGWTFTGLSGNSPGSDLEKPAGAWSPAQVADFMYQKIGEGKFYILCPDNEVTEEVDNKRILWTAGDVVYGRPPLTRWRDEYKKEAEEWMAQQKF